MSNQNDTLMAQVARANEAIGKIEGTVLRLDVRSISMEKELIVP
jgi:hypothetical protein